MKTSFAPLAFFLLALAGTACGGVAETDTNGGGTANASAGSAGQGGQDAGPADGSAGATGGSAGATGGSAGATGVDECPGYQPPSAAYGSSNEPCRSDVDCESPQTFEYCLMPGSCAPSGVDAGTPTPECTTDQECPDGVCNHGTSTCGGEYGYCVDACTDGACPDGSFCATDGHCRPLPCEQGFACPVNTRCEPGSTPGHGCLRLNCSTDDECDCGACLNSVCRDGLGRCSGPAA